MSVELAVERPHRPPWVSEKDWARYLDGEGNFIVEEEMVLDAALTSPDSKIRREAIWARAARVVLGDRLDEDRERDEAFIREHPDEKPPGMSRRSRALFKRGAIDHSVRFWGRV